MQDNFSDQHDSINSSTLLLGRFSVVLSTQFAIVLHFSLSYNSYCVIFSVFIVSVAVTETTPTKTTPTIPVSHYTSVVVRGIE